MEENHIPTNKIRSNIASIPQHFKDESRITIGKNLKKSLKKKFDNTTTLTSQTQTIFCNLSAIVNFVEATV